MQIFIHGQPKKITKNEVYYMTGYFLRKLFMGKMELLKNIKLTISFDEEDSWAGTQGYFSEGDELNSYMIWIRNSSSYVRKKDTLAHELVHVKQCIIGDFTSQLNDDLKLAMDDNNDESDLYWDNPLEIEAYGRAPGLVRRYDNHLFQNNITF
jgi:hypothetical protein